MLSLCSWGDVLARVAHRLGPQKHWSIFGWYLTSNILFLKNPNFSSSRNPISTTNNQGSLPGPFCRQHCNVKMTLNSKRARQGLGFWSLKKFGWFQFTGTGVPWAGVVCVPAWGCNYMPFDHSRMWSDIFYKHMVDDRFSLKWSVPSTSRGGMMLVCTQVTHTHLRSQVQGAYIRLELHPYDP